VRQLEVQVPNTAGGTPATSNTCLRLKVRKTFSYIYAKYTCFCKIILIASPKLPVTFLKIESLH